ncbi:MAG: Crp/Fnr family transcriptional regulator [Bacteroidetes bacterium]|nr:Crp/Fnr family transcriptional regulator [Bacteroidota bacterium]
MNDFERIVRNVTQHISLTADEEAYFISLLSKKLIRRRQFVLQEGEVFTNSCFVNSGCLRSYTIDKNGVEHILQFAPPGWWIGDFYSSITGKPAILFIDAIDESEIILLPKEHRELLFEKVPKFERFFRILIENSMASNQQRILDKLSLTAEERFEKFCIKYPTLVACLPQKYIASYIGVTPEFFSKMRSKMNK